MKAIVRRHSAPLSVRYHWQQNRWQATALNHGVSEAESKWIALLDFWHLRKLAAQVRCIEDNPNVFFMYLMMDYMEIDEPGQLRRLNRKARSVLKPPRFQGKPNIYFPIVLMTKDPFLGIRVDNPSLRIGGCLEFFTRVGLDDPIHCLNESLGQ